jgi:serine/threonine-protein kinase HipA
MINAPVAAAGDRYILKVNPPEFPHLVENEAFLLAAARRSGLTTVDATLVADRSGRVGLAVRRFDRSTGADGTVRSIAVEDGCQVLNRYPAAKYAVTAEQVVAGLVGVTRAHPVAARQLFAQLVFAYLTGNGDAHAKNFSVLESGSGEWRIAPAYDLPSWQPYGDHTLALSIGGRRRDDVTRPVLLAAVRRRPDPEATPHRAIPAGPAQRLMPYSFSRPRLMMVFWISEVPSPISRNGASRISRSISYSLE